MIDLSNIDRLGELHPVELALEWARRGVPVVACNPETKAPWVGARWEQKATADQAAIHEMWRYKPGARVGIKTGLACGCGCEDGPDVLDFDVAEGKPGLEQLDTLIEAHVIDIDKTMFVRTPSGGRHAWFCGSQQHNKQNDDSVWGVDLRAHHGMVLAPGNPGYRPMGVVPTDLGPSPLWAAVAAAPGIRQKARPEAPPANEQPPPRVHTPPAPARPTERPGGYRSALLVDPLRGFDDPVGEESPLDWFTRNNDLRQLLADAGWKFAYEQQGRLHYVRPGKEIREGTSGNIATMADGREVFYNFSSSVDLPVNTAMSVAQLYAHLHHGGSQRNAASEIRRTMMPQRPRHETAPPMALGPPPANREPRLGMDAPPDGRGALVPITEAFWDERPELRNIRWLARERRVSPWSMLGSVLALVSCRVGPHVVLPRITGSLGSLNLLVGLVGPSGKGKGASWGVALEYLGYEDDVPFPVNEIATAQGIDSTFTETPPKSGPVQFNDVAFFYVPEIDTMKSMSEANGGAILPHLRKVYSGEPLGGQTANKERRRPVKANRYRASAVVGIQPKRSGVLLGDADGGLPQRFIWMPVHDPGVLSHRALLQPPLYCGQPPAVSKDVWVPRGEQRGEKDEPLPVDMSPRWEVPVCRAAVMEILDSREENMRTEHGGLDSHALLTQLKVAALLAFLNERAEVSDDDWRLSRVIMKTSDQTRDWCARELRDAEDEENAKRGRGRAVQQVHEEISRTVIRDEHGQRVADLTDKLLGAMRAEPGTEFSPKQLREMLGDRKARERYWGEVETALIGSPGVAVGPEISSGGRKIRKVRWTGSSE